MALALVTGASSGIGLMYARELARTYKYDLVLVSNQEKEIVETADAITAEFGVRTYPLFRDLSLQTAAEELFEYTTAQGWDIEVLINNAGVFFFNEFNAASMKRIELMLMLHVVTATKLMRLYGDSMCTRGRGYILNMSSLSCWMAMPGIQCYNATKAYLYNLSKSLWYEYKPQGVTVTVMTPGAVDTALFGLSPYWRKVAVKLHVSIPPEKLVARALKKMFRGRKWGMPGVINHIATPFLKHMPDWVVFTAIKPLKKFMK